jgi:glycosyltransferase involved in cell wall biosynthesis
MRVAVFTTSYPRHEGDLAGRFVFDLVARLQVRGVEMDVVDYRDFGLTGSGGPGLVASLRRRPWLAPPLVASMVRSLRRAARDADLVHANWLAGAAVARFAGKPFVVTLHGSGTAGRFSDLGLAEHSPGLVRRLLGPARATICVSPVLAEAMRSVGIENVHEIPYGVEIPDQTVAEEQPPKVLFAGRLSPEKRIDIVAAATDGLPRIVAGDGPLRDLLPDALGFVPQSELFRLYDRAAVVLLTSEREGLPNVVLEAMARGRTVVSTPAGGIPAVIEDGKTGLLVPIGDAQATRAAVERALGDTDLRQRIGAAARERVREYCSWGRVTERTLEVYKSATGS